MGADAGSKKWAQAGIIELRGMERWRWALDFERSAFLISWTGMFTFGLFELMDMTWTGMFMFGQGRPRGERSRLFLS